MGAPTVDIAGDVIVYRLPAGGAVIYMDEVGTELFRISASGDVVSVEGTTLDPTLQAILNGVTATAAEINKVAGVTAGTTTASKALVVDANKALDVLALPASGLKIGAGAGTAVTATAAELNAVAGVTAGTAAASKAAVLSATLTLTGLVESVTIQASTPTTWVAADSGKTYVSTVVDGVFNLPATVAGLRYRVIAGVASVTSGLTVSPNAADKIMGSVLGVAITAADNKDIINTPATDVVGDFIELLGDGVDGWYLIDGTGVWAREV